MLLYAVSNNWDKGEMTLEQANIEFQSHFPGGYRLVPQYDKSCRSLVLAMEFNSDSEETVFMLKYPGGVW